MLKKQRKSKQAIRKMARDLLGYKTLRSGQDEAIQSVLAGIDTLAVMPTGFGKSAIYQIAATQIPGATVIISPLLALQKDQVESIDGQELGEATAINSTVSNRNREATFNKLAIGSLEFIFLAPEQLSNLEVLARLKEIRPSLFVVDEAHCICEWGHDFRPDYLHLGSVIEALGHPVVLALTATASPPVRQEIIERLAMRNPRVLVSGFDRPNIWLGVDRLDGEDEKKALLLKRVQQAEKPGIVYAGTRKCAEEVAEWLNQTGISAIAYHAGMKARDREQAQAAFMADQVEVIVATVAFGMGVDKPNVRFVIHYSISDSVDAYYQEIGRAGRDGEPACAWLLYDPDDLQLHRFFAGGGKLHPEEIIEVVQVLQTLPAPADPKDLLTRTDCSRNKGKVVLSHLKCLGLLQTFETGKVMLTESTLDLDQVVEEILQAQERTSKIERSRLEMMRGYAELRDCRRRYLLNYFGKQLESACGYCDNCEAGITANEAGLKPYPLNSRVIHKTWGEGLVMRYEDDKVVVLFDDVGYKTMSVVMAVVEHLLKPID